MTLSQTTHAIEQVARMQPTVNMIVRNDIFRLNSLPNVRYGVFAWLQGRHTADHETDVLRFRYTFFYVDRLTADKRNELEVQSVGVETLQNIVRTLADQGIWTSGEVEYQTFNQRFVDECAGVYASLTFEVPAGFNCGELYGDFNEDYNEDFLIV
jgi:hypothetical protein